ncbi:hypothetical protein [Nostoc sp. LEGE 12450]|nr:hypothetical protein [Nostoc sp. LEGE 12450]MBE8988034.1 hypothetical protein [Nostoc sp. LEGE 12450]
MIASRREEKLGVRSHHQRFPPEPLKSSGTGLSSKQYTGCRNYQRLRW